MPKFKGGSDDWLDDQRSGRNGSAKKKGAPKAGAPLDASEANATVAEVFPNQCRARLDEGGSRLCSYRRASVMAPSAAPDGVRERSPVAVGDRIKVSSGDPQSGVVEGVCARTNYLSRPAPDRDEGMIHVIAANVEVVVIVASSLNPEFSPGFVDRFIVATTHAGITPLVCVTKTDLMTPEQLANPSWSYYRGLGYEVAEVSIKNGNGIAALKEKLLGRRIVFCGHSGVGKTSLLNVLVGKDMGSVGAISDATGKGRHTTTSSILFDVEGNSAWIDTPGVKEFGLWNVKPEDLAGLFPEFADLEWARERQLPIEEQLEPLSSHPRLSSYRRILQSIIDGEH